jgi:hypothetical protein
MSQYPQSPLGYQPPPNYPPPSYPDQYPNGTGKALAGMILGIISLVFWCIPLLGAPVAIVGLVLSNKGLKSSSRSQAIAGFVTSIIGLVLTIINASIGAYMAATGHHPVVNHLMHH